MNDQHYQAAAIWIRLAEGSRNPRVAVSKKIVIRIDDSVVVLALIEHGVLASCRDHNVFHAIAIQIAEYGWNLGDQGEIFPELLVHEIAIDGAVCRRILRDRCSQHRNAQSREDEEKCFSHSPTLVSLRHRWQVTKVIYRKAGLHLAMFAR